MANSMDKKGLFIVIEGTDGSGKGTQFKLLEERLKKGGYNVETFDFPRYDQPSSHFIKEYLNGKYGSGEEVGPYTASLFFALDRYEAAPAIRLALAEGKVVIANRFTGSNMAHQGTKFNSPEERRGYFIWLDNIEFEMLKVPRPDKSIVLRVPADIAQQLVDNKDKRAYTEKKRDLHEADITHLRRSVEVYDDLCQLFPKDFQRLDCVRGGELLDIATISDSIWESVRPLLPLPSATSQAVSLPQTEISSNPYIDKSDRGYEITSEGRRFLEDNVTNVDDNVYAFNENMSSVTIAAAMARLSRRGDDMRITLLDEFAGAAGKDAGLLKRVITAYGDDSVQQLVGQHLVVENASNLLIKKLEWGRLAAYLEQSTRYIYFDQKDKDGKYKYHTPQYFDKKTKQLYEESLDKIFDLYSEIVRKTTQYVRNESNTPKVERDAAWQGATRAQACDAARTTLPVATKATVGIHASGQALESLIMHLLSDELPEAHEVGRKMLVEARKTIPMFLERIDINERGVLAQGYRAFTFQAVKDLATKYLPDTYGQHDEVVRLTSVWPRNELELVPDMLYEHSNLSLKEIKEQTAKWPIEKKSKVFTTYMGERLNRRHKPGRAIENAHYSWDLICDYGIFRDLQRHRMVDDLEWQTLSPRYGYETPALIEDAGLSELYEECFDISVKLHSQLIAAGYELEAQYATLLGHRMRWKVTFNAREAFHLIELRTSPQGHPAYRKLAQKMYEKLAEAHPLMGEAMKFVNQGEDAELTRLAAEKYTQYKLQQIDKE